MFAGSLILHTVLFSQPQDFISFFHNLGMRPRIYSGVLTSSHTFNIRLSEKATQSKFYYFKQSTKQQFFKDSKLYREFHLK